MEQAINTFSYFSKFGKIARAGMFGVAFVGLSSATAFANNYEIDSSHSSVGFKVKHLAISSVTGSFGKFSGNFTFDPNEPTASTAEATIEVPSIHTAQAKRDDHLRGEDFFDAENFPKMNFQSTAFEKTSGDHYKLTGNLTLRGVTKPVVLDVVFGGIGKGMQGEERAAFSATGSLNRKDFGLTWNKLLETGTFVVGDEVTIQIEVEGVKK